MKFLDFLKDNLIILDGGFGTLLQEKGLPVGELPERWNITNPNAVIDIHKSYFDSGSNVVSTNTFGANCLKFSESELEEIIKNAVNNAKIAKTKSVGRQEKFIALDIGPIGKLLKPFGDFDFEEAFSVFAKTVKLGVKYGVDLVLIETMNDSYETKAAVLAVKENSSLPIFVCNAYDSSQKLLTGATPEAMVALLEGLGVSGLGANCSLGPKQLSIVVNRLLKVSSTPVIFKPNAGIPVLENGKTKFNVNEIEFSSEILKLVEQGVRVVGGCCGTTPSYIKKLSADLKGVNPLEITNKNLTVVSSYAKAVNFENEPILIGERINPTGKKRFKQALIENDIDYILKEGISQQEKGVDILDVNVGLPEINEQELLKTVVVELQSIIDLPLQIDTSNVNALENALRVYNGKPLINSVNGKKESMQAIFPLVKKYGGAVIALTLDENGIPKTSSERVEIAKKIIRTAKKYGISKKDIIFDTLAMAVSADNLSSQVTLTALKEIKTKLNCHTSLGVSNISFGLPNRDFINSTFFALALENGLSCAIINPNSLDMLKTYYSFKALKNKDQNLQNYVNFASAFNKETPINASEILGDNSLKNAIIKGLKTQAVELTKKLLLTNQPLSVINEEIIPALNVVGEGYEKGKIYLPQLLVSAETAKLSFEVIKNSRQPTKTTNNAVILATVEGDIHDIGKNIVKLLLENFGFKVIDLGKDVKPKIILEKALETGVKLVGLSALMTTTAPAMEKTITLLKQHIKDIKIVVGGAVLTKEYALKIGADKFAKDGMETVRYAQQIFKITN